MKQNVLYRTSFGKHLVVITALIAISLLMPVFALSPEPFLVLQDEKTLRIMVGTYLVAVGISGGTYLLFQILTYRKLIFVNNRITLVNLFGKEVTFDLDQLIKVTPSRAAYNFHVGPPHEKIFMLYCYMGPKRFEKTLEQISRKRMGRGTFTFEYGSTVKEF